LKKYLVFYHFVHKFIKSQEINIINEDNDEQNHIEKHQFVSMIELFPRTLILIYVKEFTEFQSFFNVKTVIKTSNLMKIFQLLLIDNIGL
jgi:hypothetical protein